MQPHIDWIAYMREELALEVDRHYDRTRIQVNEFWAEHHRIRQQGPASKWGSLGVRLRPRRFVFSIEWFVNRIAKVRGETRVFSHALRISKNRAVDFRQAESKLKSWELSYAGELEADFAETRRMLDELLTIHLRLGIYERRVTEFDNYLKRPSHLLR